MKRDADAMETKTPVAPFPVPGETSSTEVCADISPKTLSVARRVLTPQEVMLGAIWLGPGPAAAGADPGQDNADATVAAAVAHGILDFDTAPWYGAGSSEERLGKAVARHPSKENIRVFTKAGRLFRQPDGTTPCSASFEAPGSTPLYDRVVTNDFTGVGARVSLSESLARINTQRVYGLRIHDPNDNNVNDGSVDEVAIALKSDGMCTELRRMRAEGIISDVSLGMNCNREPHIGVPEEIIRLIRGVENDTFDSVLLAGGWNLLTQAGLPCLVECERRGIAVHIAGIFCSGLLVGGSTYAYREATTEMKAKTGQWRALAERYGLSLQAVAIAFAAMPKCVTRIVIGMATASQVEENMAALAESNRVPEALWADAKGRGLLGPEVPMPS